MYNKINKLLSYSLVILGCFSLIFLGKNLDNNSFQTHTTQAAVVPTISGVSGNFASGSSLTISGNNFGTRSTDDVWFLGGEDGWIENAALGTDIDTAPSTYREYGTQGAGDVISDIDAWSGDQSINLRIDPETLGTWASTWGYKSPQRFTRMFASFWFKADVEVFPSNLHDHNDGKGPTLVNVQHKFLRVTNTETSCDDMRSNNIVAGWGVTNRADGTFTSPPSNENSTHLNCVYSGVENYEDSYGIGYQQASEPYFWDATTRGQAGNAEAMSRYWYNYDQWNRVDMMIDIGTLNNYDGRTRISVLKPQNPYQGLQVGYDIGGIRMFYEPEDSSCLRCPNVEPDSFLWYNLFDATYDDQNPQKANMLVDDPYVQVGSWARVELGDNPIYENSTKLEIQMVNSWNNGQINFDLNYGGSFQSGDTAYVFVIDNNNNISQGYPITLSGTTQSPQNPVSSSLLLYSTMDNAQAIFSPQTAAATYTTISEAIPGEEMIDYVAGYTGQATLFDGSGFEINWPVDGPIRFKGENFDFDDPEGDGGRLDFKIKFNENPHTDTANTWIARTNWDQGLGVGDRLINYEFAGSPANMMIDVYSDIAQTDKTNYSKFRVLPRSWDRYQNIQEDEWHTFSFTWRNNGLHKDEIHFYIDGTQEGCETCSDYNGNLPPLNSITDFYFSPVLYDNYRQFSIDEVYSFDSWDTSGTSGNFVSLYRPEGVTITYPQKSTYPIYGNPIDNTNPIFEFFVINEQSDNFSCSLYVDGQFVRSVNTTNDSHMEISGGNLNTGTHNLEIVCDNGRLSSGVREFTITGESNPLNNNDSDNNSGDDDNQNNNTTNAQDTVPQAPNSNTPGSLLSGQLVKVADSSTVYYIGTDYKKYVFPDANTYFSWFENFDNIKIVSVTELDKYTDGGVMTYRPGTYLVTSTDTAKVYAVSGYGKLHWIENEATARRLYGSNWQARVRDIDPGFLSTAYQNNNDNLLYTPIQTIYKYNNKYYLRIDKDNLQEINSQGLQQNNFNTQFAIDINSMTDFSLQTGQISSREDKYFYLR